MEPLAFAAIQSTLVGLVLLLFVKNYQKIIKPKLLLKIIPSVFMLIFFLAFYTLGVAESGALKGPIFVLLVPVFVYFFAVALLHEPIIKRILAGGVVALIGSFLLIGLPVIVGAEFLISDLYLVAAYASLGGVIVHGKYLFKFVSPNELLALRFTFAGLALTGYVLIAFDNQVFVQGEPAAWLALLYAIVVSGILANTLYYRSLRYINAE